MSRLDDCGKSVSNKKFCTTSTETYIWELVAYRMDLNYKDWAYMESPFQLRFALGADGIGFREFMPEGNIKRCTKFKEFKPMSQGDWTMFDYQRENQFSRCEKSLGPRTPIRPMICESDAFNRVKDIDGYGIFCFYDKLYVSLFTNYVTNNQDKSDYIDVIYDFMFVPRKVKRMDYMQHLISRVSCNPNPCIEQTLKELPCISITCHFPNNLDDKQPDDEILLFIKEDGKTEKKFKVKDLLEKEPVPKPCFNVCQDPVSNPCTTCESELSICNNSLITCLDEVKNLRNLNLVLAGKLSKAEDDLVKEKQLNATCKQDLQNTIENLKTAIRRLDDEKKLNKECQEELQKHKTNHNNLLSQIAGLEAEKRRNLGTIDSLTKENTNLNANILKLTDEKKDLNDKLGKCQELTGSLRNEVKKYKEGYDTCSVKLKDITFKYDNIQISKEALNLYGQKVGPYVLNLMGPRALADNVSGEDRQKHLNDFNADFMKEIKTTLKSTGGWPESEAPIHNVTTTFQFFLKNSIDLPEPYRRDNITYLSYCAFCILPVPLISSAELYFVLSTELLLEKSICTLNTLELLLKNFEMSTAYRLLNFQAKPTTNTESQPPSEESNEKENQVPGVDGDPVDPQPERVPTPIPASQEAMDSEGCPFG